MIKLNLLSLESQPHTRQGEGYLRDIEKRTYEI